MNHWREFIFFRTRAKMDNLCPNIKKDPPIGAAVGGI